MKLPVNEDSRFNSIATLIVKVTHRCNLDCSYCYENITAKGPDMPIETFKELVDKVIENSNQQIITFLFHGGEPTLIKNDWYQQAMDYAIQKATAFGKQVRFSMQTNLFSVSLDKIFLFKKYSMQVGISLDQSFVEAQTSRGGEAKVFSNYLKLKENGINCGILSTINHSNYNNFYAICEFMHKAAKVNRFKANVMLPVGRAFGSAALTPEKIFQAELAILDYMTASEGAFVESNLMLELTRYFSTDEERLAMPPSLCHERICGAGKSVIGVTPTGDILPCGRFQWNDHAYFLGNLTEVNNNTFTEAVADFQNLVPETYFDCTQCDAKKICRFGCQAFIVRSKEKANTECLPTKMKYNHIKNNEKKYRDLLQKYNSAKKIDSTNSIVTLSSKKIQTYA